MPSSARTLRGILTSWNPAAERMFGYSSEETVGTSAGLLTPEDRNEQAEAVMAGMRNGQPVEDVETTRVRRTQRCCRSLSPSHRYATQVE